MARQSFGSARTRPPRRIAVRPSLLAAVGALVVAAACATNPATGNREFAFMSEAQEIALGQQADLEIQREMGIYEDDRLQRYVEDIGFALAAVSHRPDLPWQFTVVDSPAVNAFAVPGGYIYLTRGIMAYLEDEAALAGVLGHEIGHVTARHSVQAYTRSTGAQLGMVLGQIFVPQMRGNPYYPGPADAMGTGLGLLFLKFGRDDEIQADRLGAEYASQSGWDPAGVSTMLTTLGRIREGSDRRGTPNWLSTHPEPEARVADVEPVVAELLANADLSSLQVNRAAYLEQIDGMRFGDNPEQGIVRGNEFLHPIMGFALEFPEGWEVQNSDTMVMAQQPGEQVYMMLQLAQGGRSSDLEELAVRSMEQAGYRYRAGGAARINGLEAHLGTYTRQVDQVGDSIARVAYIREGRQVYVYGGVGPVAAFERTQDEIEDALRTFRALSRAEADAIRPNEIALYTAREGDTWQSIAQRGGDDVVTARTLAVMNGYPVNEQPLPGDLLKVVVPGDEPVTARASRPPRDARR